jgi:regulator of telomere elongation helicase 1
MPLSVSDYVTLGKMHHSCPYFLMKDRISQCDLAILPYNYILDSDLRSQVKLSIENAVIIFDEGHNIESQCEDIFAFEISLNDLFCAY